MNCIVVGDDDDDSDDDGYGTVAVGDDDDDSGDWLWWSLFWFDHITRAIYFLKIA